MKKEDMRTKRTKKALKRSLCELLITKSFEKISVTDICELAEVNRVTFYTHYDDKNVLLNELLYDIAVLIEEENVKFLNENKSDDPLKDYAYMIAHSIYKACFENRGVILSLTKQQSTILQEMMEQVIIDRGVETLSKLEKTLKLNYPPAFIVNFLLGGVGRLTFDWALKEQNLSETEFIEKLYKFLYDLLKSNILLEL